MTQIYPWGSLRAISKEEDLKLSGRFCINPPPDDGRCHVCGRHISELKPFGGPDDPLVGDFTGELLVKIWRREGPYDEEGEKALDEYEKENSTPDGFEQPIADGISDVEYEEREDPIHWFINKFGKEKGKRLYFGGMASSSYRSSWECRDCIVLDDDEYFEKSEQTSEKRKAQDLERFDELVKEKGLTEKDKQLFDKYIEYKAGKRNEPWYMEMVKIMAAGDFEDFWKEWGIYKQGKQKKRRQVRRLSQGKELK